MASIKCEDGERTERIRPALDLGNEPEIMVCLAFVCYTQSWLCSTCFRITVVARLNGLEWILCGGVVTNFARYLSGSSRGKTFFFRFYNFVNPILAYRYRFKWLVKENIPSTGCSTHRGYRVSVADEMFNLYWLYCIHLKISETSVLSANSCSRRGRFCNTKLRTLTE